MKVTLYNQYTGTGIGWGATIGFLLSIPYLVLLWAICFFGSFINMIVGTLIGYCLSWLLTFILRQYQETAHLYLRWAIVSFLIAFLVSVILFFLTFMLILYHSPTAIGSSLLFSSILSAINAFVASFIFSAALDKIVDDKSKKQKMIS